MPKPKRHPGRRSKLFLGFCALTGASLASLMFAAAEGQTKVVQSLLEHGAVTTLQDIDGETAQDFALNNGHPQIAQMLEAHPK